MNLTNANETMGTNQMNVLIVTTDRVSTPFAFLNILVIKNRAYSAAYGMGWHSNVNDPGSVERAVNPDYQAGRPGCCRHSAGVGSAVRPGNSIAQSPRGIIDKTISRVHFSGRDDDYTQH
jgi:hypothetical protein